MELVYAKNLGLSLRKSDFESGEYTNLQGYCNDSTFAFRKNLHKRVAQTCTKELRLIAADSNWPTTLTANWEAAFSCSHSFTPVVGRLLAVVEVSYCDPFLRFTLSST